jgi:hypothetical protein
VLLGWGSSDLTNQSVILSERAEFVAAAFAATKDLGREPKDMRFAFPSPHNKILMNKKPVILSAPAGCPIRAGFARVG